MFGLFLEDVVVLCVFKLLKELEKGEKGGVGLLLYFLYGFVDVDEDEDMCVWMGMIFGFVGMMLDMCVLEFVIECGSVYLERLLEM